MDLCDNQSAPEFTHEPCTPNSDANIFDSADPSSPRYIGWPGVGSGLDQDRARGRLQRGNRELAVPEPLPCRLVVDALLCCPVLESHAGRLSEVEDRPGPGGGPRTRRVSPNRVAALPGPSRHVSPSGAARSARHMLRACFLPLTDSSCFLSTAGRRQIQPCSQARWAAACRELTPSLAMAVDR
jgi:hypothetical protein